MQARNGTLRGELKVRGGKLVKCRFELKDGRIRGMKFTGDFFMYPEEKIEELEKMLEGKEAEEAGGIINEFFSGVKSFGVSADDFIEVFTTAIKNLKGGR